MDRWNSKKIICKGGLNLEDDSLILGEAGPGQARILQNYEPALEGGYRRINGYAQWDDEVVPGTGPILGVKVALGGVIASRDNGTTGIDVYSSSGSGWTMINSTPLDDNATKHRYISYSISDPVVILTTGEEPAQKWDGSTWTELNDTGAPAAPRYAASVLSRLVLAPGSSLSTIVLSAPLDDEEYDAGLGAIELSVGDTITGLKTFRGTLYIFCQNSIHKLVGSTSDDFLIEKVTTSVGCLGHDTIQEIGADLLFLAPDGLRTVAGTDKIGDVELAVQSQKIQPILRDIIGGYSEDAYTSLIIRKKSQYRLGWFNSGAADNEQNGVLGRVAQDGWEWATTFGIPVYCADSSYTVTQSNEVVVFGHPSNGLVYRLETGSSFDGANVQSIFRTADITFDDFTLRKVMMKIHIFTQIEGSYAGTLSLEYDFAQMGIQQPQPIPLSFDGSVSAYGTGVYGTAVYSTVLYPVFKKNLIGSGFSCAFIFESNGIDPPHRIDSIQVEFSLKGRR